MTEPVGQTIESRGIIWDMEEVGVEPDGNMAKSAHPDDAFIQVVHIRPKQDVVTTEFCPSSGAGGDAKIRSALQRRSDV